MYQKCFLFVFICRSQVQIKVAENKHLIHSTVKTQAEGLSSRRFTSQNDKTFFILFFFLPNLESLLREKKKTLDLRKAKSSTSK